jgi:hypothetical protein
VTRSNVITGLVTAGIIAAFMAVALVIVMLTAPTAKLPTIGANDTNTAGAPAANGS